MEQSNSNFENGNQGYKESQGSKLIIGLETLLAALMFFTRLPFWRLRQVPKERFTHVVNLWSFTGWLTGGVMALVLWGASYILPMPAAVLLALMSRLLLTGALHEDGLADFLDGFGGGTDRTRTLAIMKDSHIGSYGVIGLILYFLLLFTLILALPLPLACYALLVGDSWSKFIASNLINLLPYARKEEESKAKTVYSRMTPLAFLLSAAGGALWAILLLPPYYRLACLLPIVIFALLVTLMHRRLQGYTGDCCGAAFLLCELSFYLAMNVLCKVG
jgi:adenosylcobinamide-GDP ribazoletransferase